MNGHNRRCDLINGCGRFYHGSLTECPHCGASDAFSDDYPMSMNDYGYDIECYPNVFLLYAIHAYTGTEYCFELSERRNDIGQLLQFLHYLRDVDARMVGFNNLGYDYPVLHTLLQIGVTATYHDAYGKSQAIFDSQDNDDRFAHQVWASDRFVTQIDLFKIHHFDNKSKRTSLKMLEVNMRMDNVQDLPFEPGTMLTPEQIDQLIPYNRHDVVATLDFYNYSKSMIEFRESLSEKYNKDFLNHNDTKIGKDFFVMQLEDAMPGSCYTRTVAGRQVNQTYRREIAFRDVILPYVKFERPEFQEVLNTLLNTVITGNETKGALDLSCVINNFQYDFGTGGIHGSIKNSIVRSDDTFTIIDLDVASYYPNLAIVNRFFPQHLSELFCDIYRELYEERKKHGKKTSINAMLKLALNGTYGASNDVYSPFYDPAFTMAITINGQLLLCMLAEQLIKIPGLSMIQVNTDGLTVKVPHNMKFAVERVRKWWEAYTLLELEDVEYNAMFIRDVNSYIAEKTDGGLKRIGAYAYVTAAEDPATRELAWHKKHSSLVVQKAAEAALVHGTPIEQTIMMHTDPFDFMRTIKVNKRDRLTLAKGSESERQIQRTSRYIVTNNGQYLTKTMPPIKRMLQTMVNYTTGEEIKTGNKAEIKKLERKGFSKVGDMHKQYGYERNNAVDKGYLVTECNNLEDFDWSSINYDFYVNQAKDLVQGLNEHV